MPWNDNANPGPWGAPPPNDGDGGKNGGGGGGGPRRPTGGGGGPRGPRRPGGPGGPDLNSSLDQLQRRMRDFFNGPGGQGVRPAAVAAVAGVGFGLWALSGFYIVQPNEQAVVTTFGAYSRSEGPGVRYHLPVPIERAEKVPVTTLNQINVGGTSDNATATDGLMLTGDENILNLAFSVTWRVSDAARYVFTVSDPEASVKAVAESAMREVVGKTALQDVLTTGRGRVQTQTAELMQKTLDSWGAGVTVVEVQIRSANPPQEVTAAFRDVTNAEQDADSAVNEANSYRNRVVNEAKGDAARLTQSAEGYREQAVREATGDAARFDQIYTEYRRAPAVTRERLYIETMQRVLQNSNKVVIDGKGASAPIILPPGVFQPKTQQQQAAPQRPAAAEAAPAQTQGAGARP